MMRTAFLIREINGSRLPSVMPSMLQRRAWSVEAYASIQNIMKNENAELREDRPTKDIPGPKAWPLFGNMLRFMPRIGKASPFLFPLLVRVLTIDPGDA